MTRMPGVGLESVTQKTSPSTAPQLLLLPSSKADSQASTDGCSETSENRFDTCSSEDFPSTPMSTPRSQASLPWVRSEDTTSSLSAGSASPPPPVPWHSFPVEPQVACCDAR